MSKLIKNVSLYSLGEILNKSIQFLLLPLYTNFLSPSDYGKLELTYLYGGILVILYGFIIENGYSRLFFDKKDVLYRDVLFGTSFFFKFFSGAIFLLVSIVLSDSMATQLFNFEDGSMYIILISISVYIKSLAEIPLKTLVMEKRAVRYVVNNMTYLLLSILSTVYFVVIMDLKVIGVLYGQIIGASIQLITLMITEWKWTFLSFSFQYFKGMFWFSLFMIPSQLASYVTYWSNRIFLQQHTSLEDIGTFSFGYKIASIIAVLLTGPLKKAISPEIYELIDQPEECKKRIRQFTLIAFLFLTIFSLVLSMFSRELIMLMATKGYESSHEVVFILSMGYVIIGMAGIVVLPINITKKTWLITLTWVLSSGINVLLNFLLVPSFGKAGATYATLLTFLFIIVMYFIFSERVYKVNFEYQKYLLILGLSSVSYYSSMYLIHTDLIVVDILLKSVVLTLSIFLLLKLTVSQEDRMRMSKMLTSKIPFLKKI